MSNAPVELPDKKKTPLIEIDWNGSVLILRLVGPNIGQRESPIITEEFHPYFKRHGKAIRHMVLDLTNVNFMSSMGLGMCVDLRNRAGAAKMKAALFGASGTLLDMLKLMKIDRHYQLVADATALDRLMA